MWNERIHKNQDKVFLQFHFNHALFIDNVKLLRFYYNKGLLDPLLDDEYHDVSMEFYARIVDKAATYGNLTCLEQLLEWNVYHAAFGSIYDAAIHGHVECMKILHKKFPWCWYETVGLYLGFILVKTAKHGYLDCMKLTMEIINEDSNQCLLGICDIKNAFDEAKKNRHYDCIQSLKEFGLAYFDNTHEVYFGGEGEGPEIFIELSSNY